MDELELPPAIATHLQKFGGTNNLNINLPDSNAILRLEVELRDKNARRHPPTRKKSPGLPGERNRGTSPGTTGAIRQPPTPQNPNSFFFPMEKVSSHHYYYFILLYGNSIIYFSAYLLLMLFELAYFLGVQFLGAHFSNALN